MIPCHADLQTQVDMRQIPAGLLECFDSVVEFALADPVCCPPRETLKERNKREREKER